MALFGRRLICHFHGSDAVDLMSESSFSPLARWLYRNCVLIVPSAHLVDPITEITGARVIVCENPVLPSEAPLSGDDSPETSRLPVLIWNSNMLASKGFADVLLAVSEINATKCQLNFWVLGQPLSDNEMSSEDITSLLEQFGNSPWLHLIGVVSALEAVELTARSNIVALPSRYRSECQPLSIIQAMCQGKAIVASTIPAMRATLGDYPAFFVQDPSVSSLKSTILDAMSSIASGRFDAKCVALFAARARQRFSAERFDRKISAVLSGKSCH